MKKIIVFLFISCSLLFFSFPVLAAEGTGGECVGANCLTNPLGEGYDSVNAIIGKAINSVMGIVGSLALLMFVYGGLTWMTSSGSQEKVKKGKDILVWSAVGLVVIFSAYGLTKFIITFLAK